MEGPAQITRTGVSEKLAVALENSGDTPLKGTIRVQGIDGWTVQPAGPVPFTVGAKATATFEFAVTAAEVTFNAFYPIHGFAEFESQGRTQKAHAVLVVRVRQQNIPLPEFPPGVKPPSAPEAFTPCAAPDRRVSTRRVSPGRWAPLTDTRFAFGPGGAVCSTPYSGFETARSGYIFADSRRGLWETRWKTPAPRRNWWKRAMSLAADATASVIVSRAGAARSIWSRRPGLKKARCGRASRSRMLHRGPGYILTSKMWRLARGAGARSASMPAPAMSCRTRKRFVSGTTAISFRPLISASNSRAECLSWKAWMSRRTI